MAVGLTPIEVLLIEECHPGEKQEREDRAKRGEEQTLGGIYRGTMRRIGIAPLYFRRQRISPQTKKGAPLGSGPLPPPRRVNVFGSLLTDFWMGVVASDHLTGWTGANRSSRRVGRWRPE